MLHSHRKLDRGPKGCGNNLQSLISNLPLSLPARDTRNPEERQAPVPQELRMNTDHQNTQVRLNGTTHPKTVTGMSE